MSVFANAFSVGVWIALIFLLVVGTLALWFVLRRENKLPHDASYAAKARLHKIRNAGIKADQQKVIELQERWDLSEILLVVVGAICQQGCARDPSTSAARFLLLSLLFMATLVITAFSAVLVAGVSTQTPTCSVGGKSSDWSSSLSKTVGLVVSLYTSYSNLGNVMTQGISPTRNDGALEDKASLLKEGRFYTSGSGTHKSPLNVSMGIPPNEDHVSDSVTKRVLSRAQLKELEAGLTKRNHLLQMESTNNQMTLTCFGSNLESNTATESHSITLSDVWPAVAQWIGGLAIALFLLIAEMIYERGFTQESCSNDRKPRKSVN